MGLLYSGVASALDSQYQTFDFDSWADLKAYEGEDCIRTVKSVLRIPRVLVLHAFNKIPQRKTRFSRRNIYTRDQFTCQYCTKVFPRHKLNLDHVIPKVQGGKTTWENIVCSCIDCNMRKGGRTPEQAGMRLMRKPRCPPWTGVTKHHGVPHSEWLPFLDAASLAYWNASLDE